MPSLNNENEQLDFIRILQRLVEEQGDRIAISEDGEAWTYDQLWDWSGRIAAALNAKQVGPESVVALQLKKSAFYVAALVGVWRCQAAWVPIDPNLPKQRIDFLLQDSGSVLTIDQAWIDQVKDFKPGLVRETKFSPQQLAYVIYTSGTTGQPKGVEVTHSGLVSMLQQQIDFLKLNPNSRSLFLLSTSFDAAVSDIGTALLSGASLWIDSKLATHGRLSATPAELLDAVQRNEITYIDIPPAVLATLNPDDCGASLTTLLVGGEVADPAVIRAWAKKVRLLCVYGPTETTVCSSLSVCDATWQRPLIGQPLEGVEYFLDGNEDGSSQGELLIAGRQLARGYRNRDELSAERFITMNGTVFYRTGDIVRKDPDGEYVFVGRVDRQIKLRGHRIEPEEIESVLISHPEVQRAAVILLNEGEHSKLVAFVQPICKPTAEPLVSHLRDHLKASLPQHFQPSHIELIENMPLGVTGKPDLAALAGVRSTGFSRNRNEFPQPPLEIEGGLTNDRAATLSYIFQQVLEHHDFSKQDSFFDVGGDSLKAIEVAAIAQTFGMDLSPHLLTSCGSIANIVAELDSQNSVEAMDASALRADIADLILPDLSQPEIETATETKILLTGATGFLGVRLLQRLLSDGISNIVCVVRGNNDVHAAERLTETFEQNRIVLTDQQRERIEVIAGDVSKPLLGLSPQRWESLSESVSHIIHSAAEVNSAKTYKQLRTTNVVGTWEALKFAATGVPKKFDFISTLSVFVGTDRYRGTMNENDDLSLTEQVYGGYAQSKWAAESLVRNNMKALPDVRIIRLGLLTSDMETNIFPQNDLLTLAVRGCMELGVVPRLPHGHRFDVTPVDFAAKALAAILQSDSKLSTWHIANPTGATSELLYESLCELAPHLKTVEVEDFRKRIQSSNLDAKISGACLALTNLDRSSSEETPGTMELFQATHAIFDMTNTQQIMAQYNIEFPEVNLSFMKKMLRPMCQPREVAHE